MIKDPVNPVGVQLIRDIIAKHEKEEKRIIILADRPIFYNPNQKDEVSVMLLTEAWIRQQKFLDKNVYVRYKSKKDNKPKIELFAKTVLKHMDEKTIYYLEDDPLLAREAKDRCPLTKVYLVDYENYSKL
jgi:hypothetical protein